VTENYPELDPLVKALTADGTADELAGEQAAVAMFSAQRATRPRHWFVPSVGMGAAAAVVVAALAGGAYAAVLPASIQHIAHRVLARIGVPDTRPLGSPSAPSPLTERSSAVTRSAGPVASSAAARPSALPGPVRPGPPVLLGALRTQITAGSAATLDGRLAPGGIPRAGVLLELFELTGSRWQLAGTSRTGLDGTVTFTVRHVTRNTRFRLAEPGSARRPQVLSAPVLVTVLPRLTVTVSGSSLPGAATVTVSARSAQPGNVVVLQILAGGAWRDITEQQLGGTRQARFTVAVDEGQYYRVVLLATNAHAGAISPQVHEPRGNPQSARSRRQQ
jgi:hypothetical protein